MANRTTYAEHTAIILSVTPRPGLTAERAERHIRAARRQVQRYGDEAVAGLLSWCSTDDQRATVRRALDTRTRVATVVREWEARQQRDTPDAGADLAPLW